MARILVIDDDANLREVVAFILREGGHDILEAADGEEGLRRCDADQPDLVLTDIRMPGQDGLAVLRHLRQPGRDPGPPVIVLTAFGDVTEAVEAMKAGAFSYLLKPFKRDELKLTVEAALRARALEEENRNLRGLLRQRRDHLPIIHASHAMAQVVEQIRRAAPTDIPVVITGESGTGKELVARALHDQSPRWDKPFIPVNCGAIPAELMESELFGHAKGAFTGATANAQGRIRAAAGGTLFLDEIAELPLALQPKLLRVLETKEVDPVGASRPIPVDFRLLCATNKDLPTEVKEGRFREDLYYRLAVLAIHVPPLRERPLDIALLWTHFTKVHEPTPVTTTPALLAHLQTRLWPGNVRELLNLNLRLLVMRKSNTLDEPDLHRAESHSGVSAPFAPIALSSPTPPANPQGPTETYLLGPLPDEGLSLINLEREVIRRALEKLGGNKSRTATYLGIPRHVLIYRLEKYDLS